MYKEEEYAKQYKTTGDTAFKEKAVDEMRDLIYGFVQNLNLSKSIDTRVLYQKGLGLALDAVETWDPSRSKLSTHVTNTLKPLSRDVYKYGPVLHTPEHSIREFGKFKKALDSYTVEYGDKSYDPLILADLSGLTIPQVKEFLARERKTYNDSTVSSTDFDYTYSDRRLDMEYIKKEFDKDEIKARIWNEIAYDISHDRKPSASAIARKIKLPYYSVNKAFTEMVETINQIILGR